MELERFWIKMCSPVFLTIKPANKHMESHCDYKTRLGSEYSSSFIGEYYPVAYQKAGYRVTNQHDYYKVVIIRIVQGKINFSCQLLPMQIVNHCVVIKSRNN